MMTLSRMPTTEDTDAEVVRPGGGVHARTKSVL